MGGVVWCGVTGSFARAVSNSIRGALAFKLLEDPDTFDASATARSHRTLSRPLSILI